MTRVAVSSAQSAAQSAVLAVAAFTLLGAGAPVASSPDLGKAEARCRPGERGPAIIVVPAGLKDTVGIFKAEVYPSNNADFLADDNVLINAGKVFRRAEAPAAETSEICLRVPGPGAYSVTLLHDRNQNRKFNWTIDGIGFAGNPRLGFSKPSAGATRVMAGAGLTRVEIVLNYKHGLGVSPISPRPAAR